MKWRSSRTSPSRWYTRPTGAWCAARRRTAPRAGWCWFRETHRGGGDSRGPGRAIPAIVTKFARCAPESITRWRSPGTVPYWRRMRPSSTRPSKLRCGRAKPPRPTCGRLPTRCIKFLPIVLAWPPSRSPPTVTGGSERASLRQCALYELLQIGVILVRRGPVDVDHVARLVVAQGDVVLLDFVRHLHVGDGPLHGEEGAGEIGIYQSHEKMHVRICGKGGGGVT